MISGGSFHAEMSNIEYFQSEKGKRTKVKQNKTVLIVGLVGDVGFNNLENICYSSTTVTVQQRKMEGAVFTSSGASFKHGGNRSTAD